jgi:sugar phosphate isomerase/epimerase
MKTRRDFIKLAALASLGTSPIINYANTLFNQIESETQDPKVFIFSKHLQFLNYQDMCDAAKEMGFDGIDLTARPKGHVLPENVAEDLASATETMKSYGLLTEMITTNVKDANNQLDRNVLEAASNLGYKFYRTGWYQYTKEEDIQTSFISFKEKLKGLYELNKQLGISGSYQNHSGHYMGSSIWELNQALDSFSPLYMGSQYDIMHATVEGGENWEIGLRLIKDKINTLVIKDFKWGKVNGVWKRIFTPLGEGMVNFNLYFSLLKQFKINVPISIHYEYDLGGAENGGKPTISNKEVFKKIKKDLTFLRESWESSYN